MIESLSHLKDDEEILVSTKDKQGIDSVASMLISYRTKSNGERIHYMVLYPENKV